MALLLSPDESTLYVAESSQVPDGPRELRAYPVLEDGSVGQFRLLHTFGRDGGPGRGGVHRGIYGMCLDGEGNIVAVGGGRGSRPRAHGVCDHAARAASCSPIPCPGNPTNCAFGGAGAADLYVTTTDGSLFRAAGVGRVLMKTRRLGEALYHHNTCT